MNNKFTQEEIQKLSSDLNSAKYLVQGAATEVLRIPYNKLLHSFMSNLYTEWQLKDRFIAHDDSMFLFYASELEELKKYLHNIDFECRVLDLFDDNKKD